MNREDYLQQLMKKKFGSVKAFSEENNIPYSTVRSILQRGIGNSSIDNVIAICKGLDIPIEILENPDIDFTLFTTTDNKIINETISIMQKLTSDNQKQVRVYANERYILQEAEAK